MAKRTTGSATSTAQGVSMHIGPTPCGAACMADGTGHSQHASSTPTRPIAKSKGMKSTVLLTEKPRVPTRRGLRAAAKALKEGGFLLSHLPGHGGQVPDVTMRNPTNRTDHLPLTPNKRRRAVLQLSGSRRACTGAIR